MNISVHVWTVTCSISNFYIISKAMTDFESKIKQASYKKRYTPKLNNQKSSFMLNKKNKLLYLLNQILFVFLLLFLTLTSYDVKTLRGRCDYLEKRL